MNRSNESGMQRKPIGWVWVWAAFVIFVALEIARLS